MSEKDIVQMTYKLTNEDYWNFKKSLGIKRVTIMETISSLIKKFIEDCEDDQLESNYHFITKYSELSDDEFIDWIELKRRGFLDEAQNFNS